MNYAELSGGVWELRHRPRWFEEDANGDPITITDQTLAEHGIYPVQHNRPTIDREAEVMVMDDPSIWQLVSGVVEIGYTVQQLPPEEVKKNRSDGVTQERNRRLSIGFDYDFGDTRGIHTIATTPQDMNGWDEVDKWANSQMQLGNTTATTQIFTETGIAEITPNDWFLIISKAHSFRQPIWGAARQLKETNPIPSDYTADSYWT